MNTLEKLRQFFIATVLAVSGLSALGDTTPEDPPPEPTFTNGWPQIERDTSHAPHTFVFSKHFTGQYVASHGGAHTFTLAADDEATVTVGPLTFDTKWSRDRGATIMTNVVLSAGSTNAVTIDYANSGGGAYFLRTGGEPVTIYNPGITVTPQVVRFAPGRGVDLTKACAKATMTGTGVPGKSYDIVCTYLGEGLLASSNSDPSCKAWPADTNLWLNGMVREATFALTEDGTNTGLSATAIFICEEPKMPDGCGCGGGTETGLGSVKFSQAFGRTPRIPGLPVGRVTVCEFLPAAALGTTAALRYDHPMMRRIVWRRRLDAAVVDGVGSVTEYRGGLPAGVSSGDAGQLFRDADGALVEELPDGLRIVYGSDGVPTHLQPRFAARIAVADLGIAVATNAAGAITSVTSVADGTMTAAQLAAGCWQLAWTSRTGNPVKTFDFAFDSAAAEFSLVERRGDLAFATAWIYDAANGDWRLDKGVRRSERTLAYEATNGVWRVVETVRDPDGGALTSMETVLSRDCHATRVLSRRDAIGGRTLESRTVSANGFVTSETDALGATTAYVRDALGRVTRATRTASGEGDRGAFLVHGRVTCATRTASGVPTETTECDYATNSVAPFEYRPLARRTLADGLEILSETFAYSTQSVVRTRTAHGVVRTRRTEYDSFGRTVLDARPDGRATRTDYGEPESDGSWTETEDEGVFTNGVFALVAGKSTRTIRTRDAAGDVVRRERLALVADGAWHSLDWETHAYSPTHRPVSSAYSDGTTSSADWICPGPLFETTRDGVTVSNSYDAAKQLALSTRYGAFGPVTTRYERDAAGRVVRETRTAANCETQTVTRAFDSRGRVTSETDREGRTTQTAYAADDSWIAEVYADGGSRTVAFNADGSVSSITGTAVVPEFTAYSVTNLPIRGVSIPCRVAKTRYGFEASPRFVRVYTDGFGDVVRKERPTSDDALVSTEFVRDDFGRLVVRRTDGMPLSSFGYDPWGDAVRVIESADGNMRCQERDVSYAATNGIVWAVERRTRRATGMASTASMQIRQLSGLSLGLYSRTDFIDERGNVTTQTESRDPSRQMRSVDVRTQWAGNSQRTHYVDGMMVSNVSFSAVGTRFAYDAYRRETSRIDGLGISFGREYDEYGRLAAVSDGHTNVTRYAHDALGRISEIADPLGHAIHCGYDEHGNETSRCGATYPVQYEYDGFGSLAVMYTYRDESETQGDQTVWVYDNVSGNPIRKIYADHRDEFFAYDSLGRLTRKTSVYGFVFINQTRGIVTTYAYDGWGNLTNTAYSDGTPSVALAFDALGRIVSARDAAGCTAFAYDDFGDCTNETVIGVAGTNVIERFYDRYGRDLGYALNGVRQTTLGYDPKTGRLLSMSVNAAGASDDPAPATPCAYDWTGGTRWASANSWSASGVAGYPHLASDVACVAGTNDAAISLSDRAYEISALTNRAPRLRLAAGTLSTHGSIEGVGDTRTLEFSDVTLDYAGSAATYAGRCIRIYAPGGTVSFIGDNAVRGYRLRTSHAGTTFAFADGHTSFDEPWSFGVAPKRLAIAITNATVAATRRTSSWPTDLAITLGERNASGGEPALAFSESLAFTSDSTLAVDATGKGAGVYTLVAATNLIGAAALVANASVIAVPGATATLAATNNAIVLTISGIADDDPPTVVPHHSTNTFYWTYHKGSDLKARLLYPSGCSASWEYDANGRITRVRNESDTGLISQFDYTYDAAGRRVGAAHQSRNNPSKYWTYQYNNRSELTNAVTATQAYAYEYDDIGNRKWSCENGERITYAANALNQYTAVGDFTPAYDWDGNQTQIKTATGIWNVTYNGENRPILWTTDTNAITMSYDRKGRRVTKNDQRFVYDGYLQIAKNQTIANQTIKQFFIWDPTEPVATRPLVWNRDGSTAYYFHDGNKNVSDVAAADDAIAAHYEYAPFGAHTATRCASASANPWRFSSEYSDRDAATVYYNYRHYEPNEGKWTSLDPLMGEEASTSYVRNSPADRYDILGLFDDGYVDVCVKSVYRDQYDYDIRCYRRVKACVEWVRRSADYKGHYQFSNLTNVPEKCKFDYTLEDHTFSSSPFTPWGIGKHFKSREEIVGKSKSPHSSVEKPYVNDSTSDSDNKILAAISVCDAKSFQSYLHQLQDTHVHYNRGYRVWNWKRFEPGHAWHGSDPDRDERSQSECWPKAEEDTIHYLSKWNDSCKPDDCCKCTWVRK